MEPSSFLLESHRGLPTLKCLPEGIGGLLGLSDDMYLNTLEVTCFHANLFLYCGLTLLSVVLISCFSLVLHMLQKLS